MVINWKDKKVLVGGGAGLIGSYMTKELLRRCAEVTVVDNLSSGSVKNIEDFRQDIRFYENDLRDTSFCQKITKGKDCVFQYAANMGGIGYITAIGADIMHDSATINLNMLRTAMANDVSHYFYSSSACIYPKYKQNNPDVIPLKESDAYPAEPDQFYGWEKLFSEKLAESYQKDYGMNIKVGRFHNVYGSLYTAFDYSRGKAPCHLIIKAIQHPDSEFIVWGDGKATRSFLHVDDCTEAVLRLMDSDYIKPINIGSDRLISIEDLARIIIGISGKDIMLKYDLSKPQGVRGRNADLSLAREVLNWEPSVSLEEGLKITYNWALKHYNELEGI